MNRSSRPGSRIPPKLRATIERLAEEGYSPPQIEEELGDQAPDIRVIRSIWQRRQPPDPSSPWKLAQAAPDDSRLVLDVMAAVLSHTEGRKPYLTHEEAAWVLRVRKVAPSVHPLIAWRLAREYMYRESYGPDAYDLDAYLAFAPAMANADDALHIRFWVLRRKLWPDRPFIGWDEASLQSYVQEAASRGVHLPSQFQRDKAGHPLQGRIWMQQEESQSQTLTPERQAEADAEA